MIIEARDQKRKRKIECFLIFSFSFFFMLLPESVTATVAILNGLTHEKTYLPGETTKGIILVKNVGSRPETICLFQNDYRFDSEGRKYFEKPGTISRSNSSWIKLKDRQLELLPQEIKEINYEINIPANADLKGTYWSLIIVEGTAEQAKAVKESPGGNISLGLKVKIQYAIQVITHIGSKGERKVRFFNPNLKRNGDKLIFSVDVENIGEYALNPDFFVSIIDEQGEEIGSFKGERRRLYPQTSVRFQVEMATSLKQKNKLLVILDNRDDNVFAAEYTLNSGQNR